MSYFVSLSFMLHVCGDFFISYLVFYLHDLHDVLVIVRNRLCVSFQQLG